MSIFSNLPLSKIMLDNLVSLNFKVMTKVQEKALPYALAKKNIIVKAQTGTGKTATFGIAIIENLEQNLKNPQCIVIAPTRELSEQISKELRLLARQHKNIKILTLCGGLPIKPQMESLKHSASIIVGTPGRILRHLVQESLNVSNVNTLILDEADKMLDMGFEEEVLSIINYLPKNRQSMLFSATFSHDNNQNKVFKEALGENALFLDLETKNDNKIKEYIIKTEDSKKINLLTSILENYQGDLNMIFCNTKEKCKEIANYLYRLGYDVVSFHGDLEQFERNDSLVQFYNHSAKILVSTDLASRGLDIDKVETIIHYDIPLNKNTYIHRIGRTGRMGKTGTSVLIAGSENFEEQYNDLDEINLPTILCFTPIKAPMKTMLINGGKKHKLRKGDILGALCRNNILTNDDIGTIEISSTLSYIAIKKEKINVAYNTLLKHGVKKKYFHVYILELK